MYETLHFSSPMIHFSSPFPSLDQRLIHGSQLPRLMGQNLRSLPRGGGSLGCLAWGFGHCSDHHHTYRNRCLLVRVYCYTTYQKVCLIDFSCCCPFSWTGPFLRQLWHQPFMERDTQDVPRFRMFVLGGGKMVRVWKWGIIVNNSLNWPPYGTEDSDFTWFHPIFSQTPMRFSWVEQATKTLFGYPNFLHGMRCIYLTVYPPEWPSHVGRTMDIHGLQMAKHTLLRPELSWGFCIQESSPSADCFFWTNSHVSATNQPLRQNWDRWLTSSQVQSRWSSVGRPLVVRWSIGHWSIGPLVHWSTDSSCSWVSFQSWSCPGQAGDFATFPKCGWSPWSAGRGLQTWTYGTVLTGRPKMLVENHCL